jgi:glycogen synthase
LLIRTCAAVWRGQGKRRCSSISHSTGWPGTSRHISSKAWPRLLPLHCHSLGPDVRILIVTNFYGINSGGEEQSCQQVVEGLNERGHVTLVLTSRAPSRHMPGRSAGVYRLLKLEMDQIPWRHSLTFFTQRRARERRNLQCLERVINEFKPDIIYIWGMWNLHRSLAALAEARYPGKVIYRFATYWPTLPSQNVMYWRTPGRTRLSQIPKRVLAPLALALLAREAQPHPLKFERAMCVSAATRATLVEAGIPVSSARIIYTGLQVERYQQRGAGMPRAGQGGMNLLYAGRLSPDKGLVSALEALAKLVHSEGRRQLRLTLVGAGSSDFEHLTEQVSFSGWQPAESMPELLQRYDVLLVPSTWPEPFSRAVLEGMISGIVVVASRIGGTPEAIVDGENGLLFDPGDADGLAQKIGQLADDPAYAARLARAGRETVLERFTHSVMMNEIEAFLKEVADGPAPAGAVTPNPVAFSVK